jgi:hypothetical protein
MVCAVVIVGGLAGSLLVFWLAAYPVGLVLTVVRWLLEKAGGYVSTTKTTSIRTACD